MADNLPGVDFSQDWLDLWLKHGPDPGQTWFDLLYNLKPSGLAEVPLWYATVIADAVKAGHITTAQARQLTDTGLTGADVPMPVHLLHAWDSLMHTLGRTWPQQHKRANTAVLQANRAVVSAQRKLGRGR